MNVVNSVIGNLTRRETFMSRKPTKWLQNTKQTFGYAFTQKVFVKSMKIDFIFIFCLKYHNNIVKIAAININCLNYIISCVLNNVYICFSKLINFSPKQ